jgi:hypothetical protein
MTTGAGGRPIETPTDTCAFAADPAPSSNANAAELIKPIRM